MELWNAVESNNAGDEEVSNHHHLSIIINEHFSGMAQFSEKTSITTPTTPRVDREEVPSRVAPTRKRCMKSTSKPTLSNSKKNYQQIEKEEIASLQPVASYWLPPGRG